MTQNKKKSLTKKVNKRRPRPKVISFKDYVTESIAALNNNINSLKIDLARIEKRMDDFETWIPKFREMRDLVIGKPVKQSENSNEVQEKL